MLGRRLSHYLIQEQIGAGGMGVVYRARDETLGRDVAIKILRQRDNSDSSPYERLLQEARTASSLNHPHICTVHEVSEADGESFIVMEYIAGEPLSALIPHGGLPTELVFEYGKQAADALAHAHSQGIIHRDLKSANVIVNNAGNVKLLDFGLSHRLSPADLSGTTATKSLVEEPSALTGTLHYLAPEVLRGELPDGRSDIWALGVVLFEMAVGSLPFHGRSLFELTTAILQEPPVPLPARVPPGLRAVILRCLSKSPVQRYQQASEVRAALEALQSSSDWEAVPKPAVRTQRQWLVPAVVGVAALAFIAIFVYRARQPTLPGGLAQGGRLTLLVSSEKAATDPELSPDGKMIAYVAGDQGQQNLFVSRVAGGERVRLTSDTGRKGHPRFSPDGERIAFARQRPSSEVTEICLIPTLGGDAIPIVQNGTYPAWSPDGTRLALIVRRAGQPEELATIAVDGSDLRVLLQADESLPFFGGLSWSPDGKTVAFVRSPGGIVGQIWLIAASGGAPRRLSNDPPGVFSDDPSFTPDGTGIVHRSNRAGATNLWIAPLDGSAPLRLTSGVGPDDSPSVARDGRIAFVNTRERGVLIVGRLDTGEMREIYSYSSTLWSPALSPDGHQIAVSRLEADGSWHLWMVPLDGGSARQLTSGQLPEVYPRFSPDGGTVVFFTYGNQPNRIWRVSVGGGPASPVTPERNESDAYGDVSPDGKWLAFARTEQGAVHAYVMPLEGGIARRLTDAPSTVPRWSPDGEWIAYSPSRDFKSGVWVMRADGSGSRQLSNTGGWPVWWPDGKKIAFQIVGDDGNTQLRAVPLGGGPPQSVSSPRFYGSNFPFDISRDAKLLVTTNSVHLSDEIWLLEPSSAKK